jgi:hypothetical protein
MVEFDSKREGAREERGSEGMAGNRCSFRILETREEILPKDSLLFAKEVGLPTLFKKISPL